MGIEITFEAGTTNGPNKTLLRFAVDLMIGLSTMIFAGSINGASCSRVFGGAVGTATAALASRKQPTTLDFIVKDSL
jgi:hypothetical protein